MKESNSLKKDEAETSGSHGVSFAELASESARRFEERRKKREGKKK